MEEKQNIKRKLNFELVPDGCWGLNLRSVLSPKQWEYIKKIAREKSEGKCMICGLKTEKLDNHERWSYDEKNHIVKLTDILAVCKKCHNTIHIGRTQILGNDEIAEKHYMKVNGISYAEYREDLGKANEENIRLSKISDWVMDLSFLKIFLEL